MKLLPNICRSMTVALLLLNASPVLPSLASQNNHSNHTVHGRAFGNPHKSQKLKPANPKSKIAYQQMNVWDRVRAGLQLPRPTASESVPVIKNSFTHDVVNQQEAKTEQVPPNTATHIILPHRWLKYQPVNMADGSSASTLLKPHLLKAKNHYLVELKAQLVTDKAAAHPLSGLKKTKIGALLQAKTEDSSLATAGQTRIRSYLGVAKQPLVQQDTAEQIKKLIAKNAAGQHASSTNLLVGHAEPKPASTEKSGYDRVKAQIEWYAQRPGYLYNVAERARPYLYHIVEQLSKNGLPLDLALLPIVESAYQPSAVSPKSAAGIWQFIPSTGKDFDLLQNGNYDARFDIPSSTQAAIHFLTGLKNHFKGNWLLALAAYNCGQATVDKAIAENLANGLQADFWSLALPEETRDYVPKLLALSAIFAQPAEYKLKLPVVKNEPFFITVKLTREQEIKHLLGKPLTEVAQIAAIDQAQFMSLNSAYQTEVLAAGVPFTFHMPIAGANQLHRQLGLLEQQTQLADNLLESFAKIDIPKIPSDLALFSNDWLPISLNNQADLLFLSSVEEPLFKSKLYVENNAYLTVHYVDNTETLKTIAGQFNVSEESIRKANKLARDQSVALGQALIIPNNKHSSILFGIM